MDDDAMAGRVLAALTGGRQIAPLTEAVPELDIPRAYRVAAALQRRREAAGARVVGRKIGYTNLQVLEEYGMDAPIWGPVYDATLADPDRPFDLSPLLEPRIEPEIVLRLGRAPAPGMDDAELMACVEAVAHAFELVQSVYPGWRCAAPDTIASGGMHGALAVGPFVPVPPEARDDWRARLAGFDIVLAGDGVELDRGNASAVMGGGPLAALAHLVAVLAADAGAPPLAAGEIVSTGTLTRALPVAPGEVWTTALEGLPLPGLRLAFAPA